ncbi:MAG TPA: DUF434 domain-containing protein [Polyangiaceae bacterium]|nr:DUF434 domain-containing protein [Polyangiaceae bacterium]
MPDTRTHRGPHPNDRKLFACECLAKLREAMADYCWLLTRGYGSDGALKLVGDHFQLAERQRAALKRAGCSAPAAERRKARRVELGDLAGRRVAVDGFNCLITVEAALSGGIVLSGIDGSHRDLASVHGTYRHVSETADALHHLCGTLAAARPESVTWYLDSPVSNSGRLATLMRESFEAAGLAWHVELVKNADRSLQETGAVAASSDGWVMDATDAWLDLAGATVHRTVPDAWVVDLQPLRQMVVANGI